MFLNPIVSMRIPTKGVCAMKAERYLVAFSLAMFLVAAVRGVVDRLDATPTTHTSATGAVLVPITRQMRAANGAPFGLLYDLGLVADNNASASYEAASLIDSDGDGQYDWQEHISGTAPDNPDSLFQVALSNATHLVWNAAPGRRYGVLATDNLADGMLAVADGVTNGAFPLPATNPAAFYSVEAELE